MNNFTFQPMIDYFIFWKANCGRTNGGFFEKLYYTPSQRTHFEDTAVFKSEPAFMKVIVDKIQNIENDPKIKYDFSQIIGQRIFFEFEKTFIISIQRNYSD
jgi:hypothetical protein